MTVVERLTANAIVGELKRGGVTHIVWLPDTESGFLYHTLRDEPDLKLVQVCREGEAVPIAVGLIVGGKQPVVIIQSTGFFESGDSLRGLAIDLKVPLVMVVGYRGWERDQPLTDSAAIYLEPVLNAWGLPYYLVESDADVGRFGEAFQRAKSESRPVVVLVGNEYAG